MDAVYNSGSVAPAAVDACRAAGFFSIVVRNTIMPWTALGVVVVVFLVAVAPLAYRRWSAARRNKILAQAKVLFHQQREHLEAKFVHLASTSGSPRGLAWKDCDFADPVSFARDRQSGGLAAFVAVTISFEAIEGGGMEEVEAVGNLRAATSVFLYAHPRWKTEGRTIMNLEPSEAIEHFGNKLEALAD